SRSPVSSSHHSPPTLQTQRLSNSQKRSPRERQNRAKRRPLPSLAAAGGHKRPPRPPARQTPRHRGKAEHGEVPARRAPRDPEPQQRRRRADRRRRAVQRQRREHAGADARPPRRE